MALESFVTALSGLYLAKVSVSRSYWKLMLLLVLWTLTRPFTNNTSLLDELHGILSALLVWAMYKSAVKRKGYPRGMMLIPAARYFCGAPMTEKSIHEFVRVMKPTTRELTAAFLGAAPKSEAALQILNHSVIGLKKRGML